MWLADPHFLRQAPSIRVKFLLLMMLCWIALPLLLQLPFMVSVIFGGLFVVRMILLATTIRKLPQWVLLILLLMAIAGVFYQLETILGRDGGVALLLVLVIVKAYEGETLRDWQILLLAQLVLMGAALLFNQNLLMAPWLIVALLCLISSLGLLAGIEPYAAIKQGVSVLILSFPLAVILFLVVPRKETPLWGIPQPKNSATTGLSDRLKPGSITELIERNEQVFNVTFDQNMMPARTDLYWRMIIMGRHQEGEWQAIKEQYTDEETLLLPNRALLAQQKNTKLTGYEMIIQDDHGRVPALDQPLADRQSDLSRRVGNVVRVNKSREGLRRIHLYSDLSPQLRQQMSYDLFAFYRQLPSGLNPQTRMLARKLADESKDVEDFIRHVLAYYRQQGFQYTLTPQRSIDHVNTTDFFLFTAREGFCEDYADATVWLARAAGIPARIVIGYQGGEYHPNGQFWQIRSKDAHAWTEIWIADKGVWQRVDPTSAVSVSRVRNGIENALPATQSEKLSNQSWWQKAFDQGQFYWQQWVVNYDGGRQNNILLKLGIKNVSLPVLFLIIISLIIICALPLVVWAWRQGQVNSQPLIDGINLLKQAVIEGSDEKLQAIGPVQLQTILADAEMLSDELAMLLAQYISWLYGDDGLPSKRQQRIWYRKIKRAIKQL